MKNFSYHGGYLILVNREFEYKPQFNDFEIVEMADSKEKLDKTALKNLNAAFSYINAKNEIIPVSGYRSRNFQKEIYDNSVLENGAKFTKKYVALPGHSEHETGLAIDLGLNEEKIDFIRPNFPDFGISKKFSDIASDFGFVLRYPAEKTHITKISYEPWHFRYVGIPHSLIMKEKDFVLEEYLDFIKNFSKDEPFIFRKKEHFYKIYFEEVGISDSQNKNPTIPRRFASDEHPKTCMLRNKTISGNNKDGFIITEI